MEEIKESRYRPSSEQNIKVFKGKNNGKNGRNRDMEGETDELYRLLLTQASSVEYLIT